MFWRTVIVYLAVTGANCSPANAVFYYNDDLKSFDRVQIFCDADGNCFVCDAFSNCRPPGPINPGVPSGPFSPSPYTLPPQSGGPFYPAPYTPPPQSGGPFGPYSNPYSPPALGATASLSCQRDMEQLRRRGAMIRKGRRTILEAVLPNGLTYACN
jgi:hypothetical protein